MRHISLSKLYGAFAAVLIIGVFGFMFKNSVTLAQSAPRDPDVDTIQVMPVTSGTLQGSTPPAGIAPGQGSVTPTFSGLNILGPIFSQKPGETSAAQSPLQIFDQVNVWGGLNAIKGIFNSDGDEVIFKDDVRIDGNSLKFGDNMELSGYVQAGNPVPYFYTPNGISSDGNLTAGNDILVKRYIYNPDLASPVTIADPLKVTKHLEVADYIKNTDSTKPVIILGTLKTYGNVELGGSIFNGIANDSSAVIIADPLNVSGNTNLSANMSVGGKITAQGNIETNGGIRIGTDAWLNDSRIPNDDWIRLSDPAGSIHNYSHGLAALKLWSDEDVFVKGSLTNGVSGQPLSIKGNITVTGNLVKLGGATLKVGAASDEYPYIRLSDGGYNYGLAARYLWTASDMTVRGSVINNAVDESGRDKPVLVKDNLRVQNDLGVNGNISATKIGHFYTRTCTSAYVQNQEISSMVKCNSDDVLISCTSYSSGGTGVSRGNQISGNTCTGLGRFLGSYVGAVTTYAVCFSPDGGNAGNYSPACTASNPSTTPPASSSGSSWSWWMTADPNTLSPPPSLERPMPDLLPTPR